MVSKISLAERVLFYQNGYLYMKRRKGTSSREGGPKDKKSGEKQKKLS